MSYCVIVMLVVTSLTGLAYSQQVGGELTKGLTCAVGKSDFCRSISYNESALPNYRNGTSLQDIAEELKSYTLLYNSGCSNAIVHLLCAYYHPICANVEPEEGKVEVRRFPPCRELCLYVRATCESVLVENADGWPTHLDCDQFPDAFNNDVICYPNFQRLKQYQDLELLHVIVPGASPPETILRAEELWNPNMTTSPSPSASTDGPATLSPPAACHKNLQVTPKSGDYLEYSLASYKQCGVPCHKDYFVAGDNTLHSEDDSRAVAVVVLIFSILGILSSAFIIATALIDRERFHYPERPIVFLACCYLVISIFFMIGSSSKLASTPISCDQSDVPFVFQHLPQSKLDTISGRSAGCVIIFFFIYCSTMSAFLWFDILTFTWFLAATLKWAEEAISKFWILYHFIAWGIPVIQASIAMGVQMVDGDQQSGTCFVGNSNPVGLGVFVFMPILVYLIVGIVFLIVGFISLITIYRELARDQQKSRHLQRLILRVGVFSIMYVTPNVILLILYIYQLAVMNAWEVNVLCKENSDVEECNGFEGSASVEALAVLALKYIMWLLVGITISFWVMTKKTFMAWRKLFLDVIPCIKRQLGSSLDVKKNSSHA